MNEEPWQITLCKIINDFHIERNIPDIEIMRGLLNMVLTIGIVSHIPPSVFKQHLELVIDEHLEKYNTRDNDE